MSRLVYFIHIQRTGGSSVTKVLLDTLGSNSFARIHIESILTFQPSAFANLDCILGHFCYGVHNFINRDYVYATFLRDPAERLASHYFSGGNFDRKTEENFIKLIRDGKFEARHQATRLVAGESVEDMRQGYNHYMNLPVTEEVLDQALYNLEFNIDFIGFHERWEESLRAFQRRYGFPVAGYAEENRRANRPRFEIPGDVKDIIYGEEWADTALYNRALELKCQQ